ncbi:MAG: hypothetical protein WBS18_13510 [Candidatus Acidiferrales bacterium]
MMVDFVVGMMDVVGTAARGNDGVMPHVHHHAADPRADSDYTLDDGAL